MSITLMEAGDDQKKEQKVVVAVDESEESMYALSWCLNNLLSGNHNPNTTLILIYIKPRPLPVYSSLDVTEILFAEDVIATTEKYNRDLANSVMTRADAIYRNYNTKVKVEKKVGSGDAKDVLCIAVDKLGADILVMGSHDYGFFKRTLLGSVSDYCAKHVKCPLVVVKRPKTA